MDDGLIRAQSARGREPPFRDLGLQGVIAGAGVSVPQLRKVEPHDVEPLGFLVRPIPCLILGGRAFLAGVGTRADGAGAGVPARLRSSA